MAVFSFSRIELPGGLSVSAAGTAGAGPARATVGHVQVMLLPGTIPIVQIAGNLLVVTALFVAWYYFHKWDTRRFCLRMEREIKEMDEQRAAEEKRAHEELVERLRNFVSISGVHSAREHMLRCISRAEPISDFQRVFLEVDDAAVEAALTSTDVDQFALAMAGTSEALKQRMFRCMSEWTVEMVLWEIAAVEELLKVPAGGSDDLAGA